MCPSSPNPAFRVPPNLRAGVHWVQRGCVRSVGDRDLQCPGLQPAIISQHNRAGTGHPRDPTFTVGFLRSL